MLYINCYETGEYFVVVSASVKEPTFDKNFRTFEIEDTSVFTFVAECLLENKPVCFPKSIENPTRDDLIVGKTDDIKTVKHLNIYKVVNHFSKKTMNVPAFAFLEFQMLNNELATRGIFITDQNREEKYLEVLEKNESELLDILERYLSVLEDVSKYRNLYNELRVCIEKINLCENIDEVAPIAEEYIRTAQ